jgi:predicted AAA+ superfamily ATPase
MLDDDQIVALNLWWSRSGWAADDPHLQALAEQPIRLDTPQVGAIDLNVPAVHVLRGPRQVGKSTDLKLLVQRALDEGTGPRAIIYLALDFLEDRPPDETARSIQRALELCGSEPRRLILLDEVTATDRWQVAVKVLWDSGPIRRDVVVCTGSSAIDLAQGTAERLPGRRGSGLDHLVLPQDFGGFVQAVNPDLPPPPGSDIAGVVGDEGQRALLGARIHLPALQRALEAYLRFGGLPAAVAEAASGATEPSAETKRILWDSLVREIQRKGGSVPAGQALLERVMRSLGSKTSWARMAHQMAVPLGGRRAAKRGTTDQRTLQSYIEMLAANYFILVLYTWKPDAGTSALAKEKKVYFGDPLLHTITADRVAGIRSDAHAQVENALALALYRRYEPSDRKPETFADPDQLHVWGTRAGGEIDFVCGPRDAIEVAEVADWTKISRNKATGPGRSLPGRPAVVATRNELEFTEHYNLVPAALLLWALSEPRR